MILGNLLNLSITRSKTLIPGCCLSKQLHKASSVAGKETCELPSQNGPLTMKLVIWPMMSSVRQLFKIRDPVKKKKAILNTQKAHKQ
jgi:hypothetical protein